MLCKLLRILRRNDESKIQRGGRSYKNGMHVINYGVISSNTNDFSRLIVSGCIVVVRWRKIWLWNNYGKPWCLMQDLCLNLIIFSCHKFIEKFMLFFSSLHIEIWNNYWNFFSHTGHPNKWQSKIPQVVCS